MHASYVRSLTAICLLGGAVWALGTGGAAGQQYVLPPPPPAGPFTKLSPFPKVRIAGLAYRSGTRIRKFRVRAQVGVILVSRCRGGKKKGCPYRERKQQIKGTLGQTRTVRINGFERRFYRVGVRLRLLMVVDRRIGKYMSLRIRRGKPPYRTDRCTRGITLRAVRCPK